MNKLTIKIIFILTGVLVNEINAISPGPTYPPTKGEIWPKPQYEIKENIVYSLDPSNFKINITHETCDILENAVRRYDYIFQQMHNTVRRNRRKKTKSHHKREMHRNYRGQIELLEVHLSEKCETYPYLDMDESYNLTIAAVSKVTSKSLWGAMHGIESFAHSMYISEDFNAVLLNGTDIRDFPRYKHRGLLIDTSRHFLSVGSILLALEAMSMNKMNVLHWHITDDQSFPFQSEKFPKLSEKGAYSNSMVYTKADVDQIVDFARDRGIRVIPEFDVPGHTRSWGQAYPDILTECFNDKKKLTGLGPMNPIRNSTYELLGELLKEVQSRFPDQYLHVGGDEVDLACWMSNSELTDYMMKNNITSVAFLHALFMENVMPLLNTSVKTSKPIVWQEVFDENVPLDSDTIVQVWKSQPEPEMDVILEAGYRVLFSSAWYLDHLSDRWTEMYIADPRRMVGRETDLLVGGEACMWGELVDDSNFLSRVWPRASAVAERLWSPLNSEELMSGSDIEVPAEVYHRIEEHYCRMRRRKIPAEPPTRSGFCVV